MVRIKYYFGRLTVVFSIWERWSASRMIPKDKPEGYDAGGQK